MLLGTIAAAAGPLASCDLVARRSRVVVALDEAFAASRPDLAARLQEGSLFGLGPAGLFGRAKIVPVALSDGAGKAIDAALVEGKRSGVQGALVTSPLIAKAILASGTWSGNPTLLVPEWHVTPGDSTTDLWSAATDPLPAYAAAGAAAGAFVEAMAKEGGSPSCGMLFAEAPSRPRAALAAFAAAYAEASDGRPLKVRELGGEAGASAGAGSPLPKAPPSRAAPSMAISEESAAQEAVAELLGSDIRVLFIALGASSEAAIKAAVRPGVAIGADLPSNDPPASLAFRIIPNDRGLAKSLAREARILSSRHQVDGSKGPSKPGDGGGAASVSALLVAGPAAATIRAAKRDFEFFLAAAARRRPTHPRKRASWRSRCAQKHRSIASGGRSFLGLYLTKDFAENIILHSRGLRSAVLPKEFQG